MSRGIRKDTPDRIRVARTNDPMALGPLLGELCTMFNITASMIAETVDSHDQTVLRWFFGQSSIAPQWMPRVMKLLCVLDWMRVNEMQPLVGNADEKSAEFGKRISTFVKLTKRAA